MDRTDLIDLVFAVVIAALALSELILVCFAGAAWLGWIA